MENQKTLEEAAEKQTEIEGWGIYEGCSEHHAIKNSFIAGSKWQAERMYSKEDMIDFAFDTYYYISGIMKVLFNQVSENKIHVIDNFKRFKKK